MPHSKLAWFIQPFVPAASAHYPLYFIPVSKMFRDSLTRSEGFSLVRCDSCNAPLRWDKYQESQHFSNYTGQIISSFAFTPYLRISHCFYTCDDCDEFQDYPDDRDSCIDPYEEGPPEPMESE